MSNFKDNILRAANGEPIIAIVIGDMGLPGYGLEKLPAEAQDKSNWYKVLDWKTASDLLNYEYSTGFGGPECQAITAWTPGKVLFVVQYDGATCVRSVPRNPINHEPKMPGGGF